MHLDGRGRDGKLIGRLRENGEDWVLEHVRVMVQQREDACFVAAVCALRQAAIHAVRGGAKVVRRHTRPQAHGEVRDHGAQVRRAQH